MCTCLTLNKKQIRIPGQNLCSVVGRLGGLGSNSKYPEPAIIVYKNKTSGPRRSQILRGRAIKL